MAKYSAIKALVNAYIKRNGKKEITGSILNSVLTATIDSLGKYFQFAGYAMPTDNPGTPDQNVCYLAGEPGIYQHFNRIIIRNEEVALLFWDGTWQKKSILLGIQEVSASVDNNTGIPSVDVSYSQGNLVLTFHNLKGEKGNTGDAAGFGTIGADVDGNIGTPGVSVETSGDNTAKNLMFHFTNLKGETGVTSVVATIDNTSGTPSCQVSLVGQQLTLAFSGLKGLKGDTGVSADYPITIYNGLDSDATDAALSAAQGKVLDGKVTELEAKVDENGKDLETKVLDLRTIVGADTSIVLGGLDYTGMIFNGTGIVASAGGYDSFMLKVQKGITYDITPSPTSVRKSNSPFSIGGSTGSNASFPIEANDDAYLLITVLKSAGDFTITKPISGLAKQANETEYLSAHNAVSINGEYSKEYDAVANDRCSVGIKLPFRGETRVSVSVLSGTDTDKWNIYRYTNGAIGSPLATMIDYGDSVVVTIPEEDDGIWLFTRETNIPSARTYGIKFDQFSWAIKTDINNVKERADELGEIIGQTWYPNTITKASDRVSQALNLGHPGENARISVLLLSGTDTGKWRIYGTNNDGTAMDSGTILVDWTDYGVYKNFVVPANGFVWFFTFDSHIYTSRTYGIDVCSANSVLSQFAEMQKLKGKTIVCFGDSITEFQRDGKGYPDYIAEMSGANVINVAIGGTQLRQRETPTLTPVNSNQCYAGLDIVNMVKAAMTQDFDIVEAAATKLAQISVDDNTAIVARLKAIDWTKVDYVTILGGTNDWHNNGGDTGDATSTDVGLTCGAINNIIERICETYPSIKLYFITPPIRYVIPDIFTDSVQYEVGDMCTYSSNYYRFTSSHLGAWNANDVEQIPLSDARIPEYYSDNALKNGKTLREFSAIIEGVVVNNHIPIYDMYNKLGWNPYNFANFFLATDNTHPFKGFKWMAEKIVRFITAN